MSKPKYFGRDGRQCHGSEWLRLRDDASYSLVKRFDNGQVFVMLSWLGEVCNADTFPEYYPLFKLHVSNYNDQGQCRPDPVEDGKTFATEETAIAAYNDFLLRWTESHTDDDGALVEEENIYTPAPPPNPDAPVSDISTIKGLTLDDCGAW